MATIAAPPVVVSPVADPSVYIVTCAFVSRIDYKPPSPTTKPPDLLQIISVVDFLTLSSVTALFAPAGAHASKA